MCSRHNFLSLKENKSILYTGNEEERLQVIGQKPCKVANEKYIQGWLMLRGLTEEAK